MTGGGRATCTYRPVRQPTSSRPAPRSGGSASTTTSAASGSPTSCPRPARWSACTAHLAGDRPGALRRGRAGRRHAGRGRVVAFVGLGRPRAPVVPLDAVRLAGDPGRGHRAGAARAGDAARRHDGDAADDDGDRHGRRPADLERPVRHVRDRAAHPAPRTSSAWPSGRRRSGRCRRASRPSRSRRSPRVAGRGRPPRAGRRRRRARPRGAGRRPSRTTIATCARESRRGWLYRGPDGDCARVRLRDRGGSGRAGRRPRRGPAGADPRPPDHGRPAARRVRAVAAGDVPIARSCPRCGPGSASTSSRSCCAGTARSPTSRATCRSPPASSSERTDRTGPDHRPGAW